MADLTFEVVTKWAGHGRAAVGTIETGGQVLAWSVPSGMGGKGEGTSPEELLAGAVATCYVGTLGALLSRDQLPWNRLQVRLQESVTDHPGPQARISRLLVTPEVMGGDSNRLAEYQLTVELARDHCFIGRHLRSDIAYEVGSVELLAAPRTGSELDVRPLPPAQRHQLIFSTLDELEAGTTVVLVNDHDPLPLRYQLEATRGDRFSWDYLESGPKTWKVRIGRKVS
jgi:osmotically inducible protein OsmC